MFPRADREMFMNDRREVIRERYRDSGKGDAIAAKSCCGPSCCITAEPASAGQEPVVRQEHDDLAKSSANDAQTSCCGSSCCAA